jgi:uncharacterized protein
MSAESGSHPLCSERFVSITTFRKSGKAVATPVWIACEGDKLIVTTPCDSGKVKRVRHTSRVELRACARFGKVKEGAATYRGEAELLEDDASQRRYTALFLAKYPIEYRVFTFIERLASRGKASERYILRITSD